MLSLNKNILVSQLSNIHSLLQNQPVTIYPCLYANRMVFRHETKKEANNIRIWKTKSFLDIWYPGNKTYLGAIDYYLKKDHLQIEYIYVNQNALIEDESQKLMGSMIEYVKIKARDSNKPKIRLSVHENYYMYNKFFQHRGFVLTDRRDEKNHFWIETEYDIKLK